MIRILTSRIYEDGKQYIEGACVADDTKPTTGLVTGSKLTEADTGDVYMFYEGDTPGWGKIVTGASTPASDG